MDWWAMLAVVASLSAAGHSAAPRSRDAVRREECFAQEKIYHKESNKCYKLLTKGPCPKGQWFVLEKPRDSQSEFQVSIEARCAREKCDDGEYYWDETKSCVKPRDKNKLCRDPITEELLYNVFGEGECACARDQPRARLRNDRNQPCHLLYSQGPCKPGEILGYRNSAADEATCIPDPCYYDSRTRKMMGTLDRDAILAPWRSRCYELGTQGPCPEGHTFKVHSHYLIPSCVSLTNAIFDLQQNCFPDERGNCQTEINLKGSKYKREILRALRAKRRRRNSGRSRRIKQRTVPADGNS